MLSCYVLTLVLLLPCLTTCWDLTLIHTNDMHAWLDQGSEPGGICLPSEKCFGGFPRIKYFTDWARRTYKNVIYLNAGDNYQGTNYYTLFKWKIIEEFVDKMGIDVMSLGNHEFDDGMSGVVTYLETVKTPWVCANIVKDQEASFKHVQIKPWTFITVEDKKVAVIGYLTPDTKYLGDIGNLTITDEIEALKKASKEVKELGADVVIALGHSGWDKDLEIGRQVPDIDLVVGGHSHTFHYTGTPPDKEVPVSTYPQMIIQPSAKVVPMVQAYAFTKYVGVLHLTFDSNNRLMTAVGNPVIMDHTVPEDERLKNTLDIWKANVTRILKQKIGSTEVDLDSKDCRLRESNFGNLIADALVDYEKQVYKKAGGKGWTDAPVALLNSGDIRASITREEFNGSITLGALLTVLPFTEKVVKAQVNGSVFKEMLEHSVYTYDPKTVQSGGFLQFSGVKVVYNVSRSPGDRVVSAKVKCGLCKKPSFKPLSPDMKITLLASSFMAEGGDGYTWLINAPKQTLVNTTFFDVVKDYIVANSPIKIGLEGRITILGLNQTSNQS